MDFKAHKKTVLLINLILGLIFIVMLTTTIQFIQSINFPILQNVSRQSILRFLLLVALILSILTLFIFNEIINLVKKDAEAKIAEQRLRDSQELVQVLRANQHDFINHLQVICGAAQLGKLDIIEEYSKDIVKQVREISGISNIFYPEIAALLYTKVTKAEEIGAKLTLNINTNLKNMPITTINLSRILGNLLDNALYALEEVETDKREIGINISEDDSNLTIIIFNRLPIISEELQNQIFNPGFTTKGENGSGLGLYNVKTIVNKFHGNVEIFSKEDEGTMFTVIIPKYH